MKKLTVEHARKLERGTSPKPFPGKYPTRWAIRVASERAGIKYNYVGKPSTAVAHLWEDVVRATLYRAPLMEDLYVEAYEFDRGGLVQFVPKSAVRNLLIDRLSDKYLLARGSGGNLLRFYHPWYTKVTFTVSPIVLKLVEPFVKPLRIGGKVYRVYSPHKNLDIAKQVAPQQEWAKQHFPELYK